MCKVSDARAVHIHTYTHARTHNTTHTYESEYRISGPRITFLRKYKYVNYLFSRTFSQNCDMRSTMMSLGTCLVVVFIVVPVYSSPVWTRIDVRQDKGQGHVWPLKVNASRFKHDNLADKISKDIYISLKNVCNAQYRNNTQKGNVVNSVWKDI